MVSMSSYPVDLGYQFNSIIYMMATCNQSCRHHSFSDIIECDCEQWE